MFFKFAYGWYLTNDILLKLKSRSVLPVGRTNKNFKIRGLILPVENKGKDFSPSLFLRVFTAENFKVLSPLFEMCINLFISFMTQGCLSGGLRNSLFNM